MFQACILSGHEAALDSDEKWYFTLMGSCELRAPTYARQIARTKEREGALGTPPVRQVFITLAGSTPRSRAKYRRVSSPVSFS